jgi:hypothetical protein
LIGDFKLELKFVSVYYVYGKKSNALEVWTLSSYINILKSPYPILLFSLSTGFIEFLNEKSFFYLFYFSSLFWILIEIVFPDI